MAGSYVTKAQHDSLKTVLRAEQKKLEKKISDDAAHIEYLDLVMSRLVGDAEDYEKLLEDIGKMVSECVASLSSSFPMAKHRGVDAVISRLEKYLAHGIDPMAPPPDLPDEMPKYCLSRHNGEQSVWVDGPFDTFGEALLKANERNSQDETTVATVTVHRVVSLSSPSFMLDVDDICEQMTDKANDEGYRSDGDPIFYIPESAWSAATDSLNRWAETWIAIEQDGWVGDECFQCQWKQGPAWEKCRLEHSHAGDCDFA